MDVKCIACGRVFDGSPVSYRDAYAKLARNEDRYDTFYRNVCPRCRRQKWGCFGTVLVVVIGVIAMAILLISALLWLGESFQ